MASSKAIEYPKVPLRTSDNSAVSKQSFVSSEPNSPSLVAAESFKEDVEMIDFQDEPGHGDKAAVEARQIAADKKQQVKRIMKLPEKAYYQIIGVDTQASPDAIKAAGVKLLKLCHPDKNNDAEAGKAFISLDKAYKVLRDPEQRKLFDRLQNEYLYKPETFGESFAPNAYDSDSGSENESDIDAEDTKLKRKPDSECLKLFRKATPYIRKILDNAAVDTRTKQKLDEINKMIKEKNLREGLAGNRVFDHKIEYNTFLANAQWANPNLQRLQNNSKDTEARGLVSEINHILTQINESTGYPKEWLLTIPEDANIVSNAKGSRVRGRVEDQRSTDQETLDSRAHSRVVQQRSTGQGTFDRRQLSLYKPGLTSDGDKILAYNPVYRSNGRRSTGTHFHHGWFIVEKPDEPNPIELLSSKDLGNQALDGYLDLPEAQRYDLSTSSKFTWKDSQNFQSVIGFASNPIKTKIVGSSPRMPVGYALVFFKSSSNVESEEIMSRGSLRKILGASRADKEVQNFYDKRNLTPPWEIKPQFWREPSGPSITWREPRLLKSPMEDENLPIQRSRFSGRTSNQRRMPQRALSYAGSEDESESVSSDFFVAEKKQARSYAGATKSTNNSTRNQHLTRVRHTTISDNDDENASELRSKLQNEIGQLTEDQMRAFMMQLQRARI